MYIAFSCKRLLLKCGEIYSTSSRTFVVSRPLLVSLFAQENSTKKERKLACGALHQALVHQQPSMLRRIKNSWRNYFRLLYYCFKYDRTFQKAKFFNAAEDAMFFVAEKARNRDFNSLSDLMDGPTLSSLKKHISEDPDMVQFLKFHTPKQAPILARKLYDMHMVPSEDGKAIDKVQLSMVLVSRLDRRFFNSKSSVSISRRNRDGGMDMAHGTIPPEAYVCSIVWMTLRKNLPVKQNEDDWTLIRFDPQPAFIDPKKRK